MQCSACRAVYSNGLENCPRCKAPAAKISHTKESDSSPVAKFTEENSLQSTAVAKNSMITDNLKDAETNEAVAHSPSPPVSTLIEFPGVARASLPQWRKDLSERVRLIQERRARAAEEGAQRYATQHAMPVTATAPAAPQLGLVPPPDAPALNPLVVAALRRIERARQPAMPHARSTMRGAAMAFARVAEEEHYIDEAQTETALAPASTQVSQPAAAPLEKPFEPAREHTLVVVPAKPVPKVDAEASGTFKREARRASINVMDEAATTAPHPAAAISKIETSAASPVEKFYDDRAPVAKRIAASMIDLVVVAFAATPFAAIIELTNGNWTDARVAGSMCGIAAVLMLLYLTASTLLAGRTWGMSLVSLRAVDADTGMLPSTKQAVARALLYILSLATFGLGILYALFDAEGRAAHDHLSGTIVVHE